MGKELGCLPTERGWENPWLERSDAGLRMGSGGGLPLSGYGLQSVERMRGLVDMDDDEGGFLVGDMPFEIGFGSGMFEWEAF